jgi:hypothetical protein
MNFRKTGDGSYLSLAISLLQVGLGSGKFTVTSELEWLVNLGVAFGTRFEATGSRDDLEEAISLYRRALVHPDAHTNSVPIILGNLSLSLTCRFDLMGDPGDLDEAMKYANDALLMLPERDVDRISVLADLGGALIRRFQLNGQKSDIDDAVHVLEECTTDERICSPLQSDRLISLSKAFRLRFVAICDLRDIDSALASCQKALELRGLGHPRRHEALSTLSLCYKIRFGHSRSSTDYLQSFLLQKEVVEGLPDDHAYYPRALLALAQLHLTRDTSFFDIPEAIHIASEALRGNQGTAALSLSNAIDLLQDLEEILSGSTEEVNRSGILDLYRQVISLVPRVAYFGLDMRSKLRVLSKAEHLSAVAAAHALHLNKADTAVELLEQGRGVFWSQSLRLRETFEGLPNDLAKKLSAAAQHLERGAHAVLTNDSHRGRAALEKEASDMRRLSDEFDELLKVARALPGNASFLSARNYSFLSQAAIGGPVVIFLKVRDSYSAIIVKQGRSAQHVPLHNVRPEMLEVFSSRDVYKSEQPIGKQRGEMGIFGAGDQLSEGFRAMSISYVDHNSRAKTKDSDILPKIWDAVMVPVIQALSVHVSDIIHT